MNVVTPIEENVHPNNPDEIKILDNENKSKISQIESNEAELSFAIDHLSNIFIDTRFIEDENENYYPSTIPITAEKGMCVFHCQADIEEG